MPIVFEKVSHVFMPDSPFMTKALNEISVEIPDGQFVGVIGHTGSGKSTMIQHINALLRPTSGTVKVDGVDTAAKGDEMIALRRKVGLVFQYPEHQLFEETVVKDVGFGPRNMGLPEEEIKRRVSDALAQVGLDEAGVGEKSPFELSGGQRRRVAIAGVLAMEPRILILDEPSAGLDPRGRREVLALVKSIHEARKITVMLVSHYMDEVAQVADRVIVMNDGKIEMDGTPAQIFMRAARLQQIGLDVPAVVRLCDILRARGVDVPAEIVTPEAFCAFTLRAKEGGNV
ncbi:MAG: energy-coupling factor transporter ATPase [Eubacteriales bacterium]|nr:energy-coupling factor transporter ATPase [Eubacteriales bacterium]